MLIVQCWPRRQGSPLMSAGLELLNSTALDSLQTCLSVVVLSLHFPSTFIQSSPFNTMFLCIPLSHTFAFFSFADLPAKTTKNHPRTMAR